MTKKDSLEVKEKLPNKDRRTRKKKSTKGTLNRNHKTSSMDSSDSLSLVQGRSTSCMIAT
jgi:hypothetical protein